MLKNYLGDYLFDVSTEVRSSSGRVTDDCFFWGLPEAAVGLCCQGPTADNVSYLQRWGLPFRAQDPGLPRTGAAPLCQLGVWNGPSSPAHLNSLHCPRPVQWTLTIHVCPPGIPCEHFLILEIYKGTHNSGPLGLSRGIVLELMWHQVTWMCGLCRNKG